MEKAEALARGVDSVLGITAAGSVISSAIARNWMVLLAPSARITQVISAFGVETIAHNVTFFVTMSRRRKWKRT